jgi:ABC-2 type transport system permease protein
MVSHKPRLISLVLTIVLGAGNLAALNYLVAGWSTARVDLTAEGLYSISPATRRILTNLDEELTIVGYFSQRTHPKLSPLVPQLVDLLDEYRAVSRGKVHVEIVDPGQSEEAEQEAADRYGVSSAPFRLATKHEAAIVNAYFAIVIKYGDQYVRYGFEELIHVEPMPDGDLYVRLRNPEYDLTRAIKKVVYGFRTTHELFERVTEPVLVTAIWTPDSLPEIFAETPTKVREAVAELVEAGGGERIRLEELDPSQDPQLRQQVMARWGAQPMSLGLFADQEFYLYALLEIAGQTEQIVLTGDAVTTASVREAIENALRRHTPGYLKTVGVVTSDPPEIPPEIRMQMNLPPQPPPEFQEVQAMLRQEYEVREVDLGAGDGVPSDVDILLVLEPTDLSEVAVYNLDQYLMRGGRIVIAAGNFDVNFSAQGLNLVPIDTGLEEWLAWHGITIDETLVLDDRNQPLPIPELRQTPFGTLRTWTLAPYPYLVQVREDGFRNPDVTASLDAVGIYWGSPLLVDEAKAGEREVIPLLQSSPRSWTSSDTSRVGYVDYEVPSEGTEPHLLAVAQSGKFESYFKDKEVPSSGEPAPAEEGEPGGTTVALTSSPATRLVVIGNAEFLSDFVARALAQVEGGFFVENLRFAQNVIDWTGLDNEMLSIRARGLASRRLDRIEESTKTVVEVVNYLVPVGLLVLLGGYLHVRRRQAMPLGSDAADREVTPAAAS